MPYVRQEVRLIPGDHDAACVTIEWTSKGVLKIFAHFAPESGGLQLSHRSIKPETTTADILSTISAMCADLLTIQKLGADLSEQPAEVI